ncbi:MAG: hypothetical protein KAQ75_07000 [Bacteroidales bacterium]|nr:hypothetical protein [Bacteroidales bacterium]
MKQKLNILIIAALFLIIMPLQFGCEEAEELQPQQTEEQAIADEQGIADVPETDPFERPIFYAEDVKGQLKELAVLNNKGQLEESVPLDKVQRAELKELSSVFTDNTKGYIYPRWKFVVVDHDEDQSLSVTEAKELVGYQAIKTLVGTSVKTILTEYATPMACVYAKVIQKILWGIPVANGANGFVAGAVDEYGNQRTVTDSWLSQIFNKKWLPKDTDILFEASYIPGGTEHIDCMRVKLMCRTYFYDSGNSYYCQYACLGLGWWDLEDAELYKYDELKFCMNKTYQLGYRDSYGIEGYDVIITTGDNWSSQENKIVLRVLHY